MFVLVAFDALHPLGGVADAVGVYDTLDAAMARASRPWGLRLPTDHEVCEIHERRGERFRAVAEWHAGGWRQIDAASSLSG